MMMTSTPTRATRKKMTKSDSLLAESCRSASLRTNCWLTTLIVSKALSTAKPASIAISSRSSIDSTVVVIGGGGRGVLVVGGNVDAMTGASIGFTSEINDFV